MAKPVNQNLEGYTHEGDFTWQEAVKSSKASGVVAVSPCQEMLSPQGYRKHITNKGTNTYITVSYDKDYVFEYFHKKEMISLGFMPNNVLDTDNFMQYIQERLEYSRSESKRKSEAELIREAETLAIRWGHNTDYWLAILKKALEQPTQTKEAIPADNHKTRTKVA